MFAGLFRRSLYSAMLMICIRYAMLAVVTPPQIGIVCQSFDMVVGNNVRQVKNALKADCDPSLQNLQFSYAEWQEVGEAAGRLNLLPKQLLRSLYSINFTRQVGVFSQVKHWSVCAITHVFDMGNFEQLGHCWGVNTVLLNALFASGLSNYSSNAATKAAEEIPIALGKKTIRIDLGNRPIDIDNVCAFSSANPQRDSHSERAIASLLSNMAIGRVLPLERQPAFVMIHIQSGMPSCSNCYHAIANAPAERKRVGNNFRFVGGKGLADIYHKGGDPTNIVTNDANFNNDELTAVGNIPVSIGIGHRDGQIFNIDWIDRY